MDSLMNQCQFLKFFYLVFDHNKLRLFLILYLLNFIHNLQNHKEHIIKLNNLHQFHW